MRLVRTDADGRGETFELTGESLIIGRQTSRGQQIEHPTVSREHARFYVRDGIWQLADLNSSNGTFVNGAKITKATLKQGDIVMLGSVELRLDAAAKPVAAAHAAHGANSEDEISLEDDFFETKKPAAAPTAAPRMPGPTLSTSAPSMAAPPAPKRLSMKNLERKSDAPKEGGVLQNDIAQYGGFMKLVIVTACLAAAYGLYLGTMKLTETVVPERKSAPAEIDEPDTDAGADASDDAGK